MTTDTKSFSLAPIYANFGIICLSCAIGLWFAPASGFLLAGAFYFTLAFIGCIK